MPAAQSDTLYKGIWLDPPKVLGDWTLTSQDGTPLGLSDLRGKPALLFFGYTSCPDICPTTLADYKQIQNGLGDQGDTEYLKPFGPGFVGLTGDDETVAEVARAFGAYFQPVDSGSGENYLVGRRNGKGIKLWHSESRVTGPSAMRRRGV